MVALAVLNEARPRERGIRMTTKDVVSPRDGATQSESRPWRWAALAAASAIVLAGCSSSEGLPDGMWNNGDVIYAPLKEDLFDSEGTPLCNAGLVAFNTESRGRAYAEYGGVVNLFLWEAINPLLPPDGDDLQNISNARQREIERQRRALAVDPAFAMYQYTHPDFDEKFGIESAEDMEAIRDEIAEHLVLIADERNPMYTYVRPQREWLEFEDGSFYSVSLPGNVDQYVQDNNIDHTFAGLVYEYRLAVSGDGNEYLMVTERETGATRLMSSDETIELDENAARFFRYTVRANSESPDDVYAEVTLIYDQCPPNGDTPAGRYWVYDYNLIEVVEREPVVLL